MRAQVTVRLKPAVLDPQGEAVHHALEHMGFEGVNGVRVGKLIEIDLDDRSAGEAKKALEDMADRLLANPVIESYEVTIQGGEGGQ